MATDLFSLEGRVALVTGGSRGIGKMIAAGFIAQGAKVYISSRKAADCDATAERLSAGGGTCISLPQDISTVEGCQALAERIGELEPQLDILVNNAGAAWGADFDEFPESGWDKVLNLNLKSPFFLTQALHAKLAAGGLAGQAGQGDHDRLDRRHPAQSAGDLFLPRLQVGADLPDPAHGRAADRATRSWSARIAPGAFASDMNRDARDHGDEVAKRIPLRRIGRDEDMAGAAIYLASRAGDYVVGETIAVDGGVALAN